MAYTDTPDSATEPVPGTPGIREVRSDMSTDSFGLCTQQSAGGGVNQGTRKVGLRAEIDTSPPFGSVKEAVTRFGGSGSWMPYYKFGIEEIDIKKVEEKAAELEKDLIVKELETLDVLEELGTTKRVVEELKRQIQIEALKCMTIPDVQMSSPAIKEMNTENYSIYVNDRRQRAGSSSPCPASSPDLILMELKQAKLNLGKTITDLRVIQTSVESLNKKIKKEKTLLEKTRERLTSKFAGVLSLEEELKQARVKQHSVEIDYMEEQLKKKAESEKIEVAKGIGANEQNRTYNLRTAELRLVAAKKMEEAARAAEAVALAEIKALSTHERSPGFALPRPEKISSIEARSPLTPRTQKVEGFQKKKTGCRDLQRHEDVLTKMSILKKMREATEEVKLSKQSLEEALNQVERANRMQFAAEEALRKWMPDIDQEGQAAYYATRFSNFHFHQDDNCQDSPLNEAKGSCVVNENPKPVLKSTVSMRDVLSRKQVLPQEYMAARPLEGSTERQKVALSQMLHELRQDLTYHPRGEKEGGDQKQIFSQRRKFGFIHISLPMTRTTKKKMQDLNSVMR